MHDELDTPERLIAHTAAALVVDEGLDMQAAKQRALRQLGLPARTRLPSNEAVLEAVDEHISLYCADTQPQELAALRTLALDWLQRLASFQPLLGGAVWRGSATRLSNIHLQIFSDDPKEPAIFLLNEGIDHEVEHTKGIHGTKVDVLGFHVFSRDLQDYVTVHLWINDTRAMRGALLPDANGHTLRGNAAALAQKIANNGVI